jgi:FkbH-like protein
MNFAALKKNLKKDFSGLTKVKLAILGDTPTQLVNQAIRGYGFEAGLDLQIYEADFDQIEMQVMDQSSELYAFKPDFVYLFNSTQKLMSRFYKSDKTARKTLASDHIAELEELFSAINAQLKCKIIYPNFPEINDAVFGNYANKTDLSFTYQLRKTNFELMNLASKVKNVFISDLSTLQNEHGRLNTFTPSIYINTGIVFNLDFLPLLAKSAIDIIQALSGRFRKCLILDLDNTTWGGIIGDDGLDNIQVGELGIGKAFTELQAYAKQLKERGIILAICSKNTESIAMEPFEKHPDMVLRMDDIAVFVANWETKVDNIRHIQSVLNIGFDSMVFLDDNPFERNIVRENIPELCIPELPEDPAEYVPYLQSLNLFETASLSEEDENRTLQYREEAKRTTFKKSFASENEFLLSLHMQSEVRPFDSFYIPRIAQLSQRSNQFNLRTVRYTEQDISGIVQDENYDTLYFTLSDKFGDHGLISFIILKKENNSAFIDTWIMSCRVLKRSMENFVLNTIAELARKKGYKSLVGEYLPTPKNALVKDHYQDLGFKPENGRWVLDLDNYSELNTFITKI